MNEFDNANVAEKFQLVMARARLLTTMLQRTAATVADSEAGNLDEEFWRALVEDVRQQWNTAAVALNDLCSACEDLTEAIEV